MYGRVCYERLNTRQGWMCDVKRGTVQTEELRNFSFIKIKYCPWLGLRLTDHPDNPTDSNADPLRV
jgi:hypothetical protein